MQATLNPNLPIIYFESIGQTLLGYLFPALPKAVALLFPESVPPPKLYILIGLSF